MVKALGAIVSPSVAALVRPRARDMRSAVPAGTRLMTATLLAALSLDWQTKRVIAEKLGCSVREAELEINAARLAGAAILSGSDGYRLAQSVAEVEECYRRLRTRAIHQLVTARALRTTARKMARSEHRRPEWPAWTA